MHLFKLFKFLSVYHLGGGDGLKVTTLCLLLSIQPTFVFFLGVNKL